MPRALDNERLGSSWTALHMMGQSLLRALERALKPRVSEGFQQVVEGACLECAQCVVVLRGYEDDYRSLITAQKLENVEAVAIRHLHVEEHKVGPRGANLRDCLRTGLALVHCCNVRVSAQSQGKLSTRERF